jgi:hypothetical protein
MKKLLKLAYLFIDGEEVKQINKQGLFPTMRKIIEEDG